MHKSKSLCKVDVKWFKSITRKIESTNSWMHSLSQSNSQFNHEHFIFIKISILEVWFKSKLRVTWIMTRIMPWMCKLEFSLGRVIRIIISPNVNQVRVWFESHEILIQIMDGLHSLEFFFGCIIWIMDVFDSIHMSRVMTQIKGENMGFMFLIPIIIPLTRIMTQIKGEKTGFYVLDSIHIN